MQWYYLSDTHERIALSEAQFAPLAARGILRPTTPVWRKGLPDWTACGEVKPEIFVAAVVRDSDGRNPVTESAAIKGTLIELGRTLANYGVWVKIASAALVTEAFLLFGGIGWQSWLLIDKRAGDIHRWLPFRAELEKRGILDWAVCAVIAAEAISAVIALWMGILLSRSAAMAVKARESGSEAPLHRSIRDAGRSLAIAIVWAIILLIAALSLSLWLGWEKAFPSSPPATSDSVTV